MEEYIIENIKSYKNLADVRVSNISEIKGALEAVADYIVSRKRILYGGMAIDFALKSIGHEGIYGKDILPDYDFYSPENIIDSLALVDFLKKKDYENASAINGIHLTSRRVRINKTNYVADLSYYPEPYYSRIKTGVYKNFRFVHPDFQRIDLHLSLSYLYGPYGFENFRNRLIKDVKRFNLIEELIPFSSDVEPAKPGLFKDLFINNYGDGCKVNITKIPEGTCIAGYVALELMLRLTGLSKETDEKIESPDYLELFVNEPEKYKMEKYEATCDVIPEAGVDHDKKIIYYNNSGRLIAANKTVYGVLVNVHYLCTNFLFRYFMTGEPRYFEYYSKCLELIKIGHDSNLPNSINGHYYGTRQIFMPALYNTKKDSCDLENKNVNYRPQIERSTVPEDIKVNSFITYQIGGRRVVEFADKTPKCTMSALPLAHNEKK